jgi:hypothetical protein
MQIISATIAKGGFAMSRINRRYLLTFFAILIIIMAAAYILNVIVPQPYSKPVPGNKYGYDASGSYYKIGETNEKAIS